MAEVIAAHCETDELRCHAPGCGHTYPSYFKHYEGDGAVNDRIRAVSEHIEAMLAAAGYGKLEDAWESGRRAGYDAGSRWAFTGEDKDTPNPYQMPKLGGI